MQVIKTKRVSSGDGGYSLYAMGSDHLHKNHPNSNQGRRSAHDEYGHPEEGADPKLPDAESTDVNVPKYKTKPVRKVTPMVRILLV